MLWKPVTKGMLSIQNAGWAADVCLDKYLNMVEERDWKQSLPQFTDECLDKYFIFPYLHFCEMRLTVLS